MATEIAKGSEWVNKKTGMKVVVEFIFGSGRQQEVSFRSATWTHNMCAPQFKAQFRPV